MTDLLLQTIDLDAVQRARQLSELVTLVLGAAISYIAYRAYRQNQSRPMLFIAVGFALIVFVPAIIIGILIFVFNTPTPIVNSLAQVSELLGLGAILYGLWAPRRS
jgi:hypothetical protein